MPDQPQASFTVSAYDDPAVLKIRGKANFLNCAPVGTFFSNMIARGRTDFVVDFVDCTGMDSTFLGILASVALELRALEPRGNLVLVRLNSRNLELVHHVGLHRILTVDDREFRPKYEPTQVLGKGSEGDKRKDAADAGLVLRAHEALTEIDESNLQRFQDVVAYLKSQVEEP